MTANRGAVGKRGPKAKPPDERAVKFTISLEPEQVDKLDVIANALDTGRSRAVGHLVDAARIPKRAKK